MFSSEDGGFASVMILAFGGAKTNPGSENLEAKIESLMTLESFLRISSVIG